MKPFFDESFRKATSANPRNWDDFRRARVFVTGGTGFFGCWLLRFFDWVEREFQLGMEVQVLTRNAVAFQEKEPELSRLPFVKWVQGDVRTFEFPRGSFTHVIHAATEASAKLNSENPLLMVDTITEGTLRALEFARKSGARRFLLTSSGAIYGKQPSDLTHVPETFLGGPDPLSPASAYGEGKRLAELLSATYFAHFQVNGVVARCFAFVGPYLPWDAHFAVGNFIRDAVQSQKIHVKGDGTPYRSYLYGADLAVWLMTILIQGRPGLAYNVGSEKAFSIRQIAETVARTYERLRGKQVSVEVTGKAGVDPKHAERYVPSTRLAAQELRLGESFSLAQSVEKTLEWADLRGN